MKRFAALALLLCAFATTAQAALKVGDKAPDFTLTASLGGKQFQFALAEALKKGPVVLYFYPAAFTPGCTIEAHEFAEATDKFAALGATVIGVSTDKIETLDKFSVTECRNKFAVAADPEMSVTKSYDARMLGLLPYASRTSYVISPDAKIIFEYSANDPTGHVDNTLAAVTTWKNAAAAPAAR